MTDAQAAVMVSAWAHQLGREIEILRAELPEDLPRKSLRVYRGSSFLGEILDRDPEHFEEVSGEYRCLDGLVALHAHLENAVAILTGLVEEGEDAEDRVR